MKESKNRFVADGEDLILVTNEEFISEASKVYNSKPIKDCELNTYCLSCDNKIKTIAQELSNKIFESYLKNEFDNEIFNNILLNYANLCKKILSEKISLTKRIYYCSKIQFVELIRSKYTDIIIDSKCII